MNDFDFFINNHGSIVSLHAMNDDAEKWIEEYIDVPDWESSSAVHIEPRYVEDIIAVSYTHLTLPTIYSV